MMVRLAFRLGRWGIAGFAAIAGATVALSAAGFYVVAGHTAAERQAFGRSISILASQFSVIVAPPLHPDTVGGFVQFRAFGPLAIMFAIWALVSGSAAARGDEERGIVGAVLASGLSRVGMIGARLATFAAGSLVAALAGSAALLLRAAWGGESFSVIAAIEAGILLASLCFCCYGLTLLIAQFTPARSATAIAGMLLLGTYLVNSLSRTFDFLLGWRWLSPFHYYELSRPLPPGGNFDADGLGVLVVVALAAGGLTALAFAFRDLGSPLVRLQASSRPAGYELSRLPVWDLAIVRDLYDRRVGLVTWIAGVAALGAIFVVLTKTVVQPLLAIPSVLPYFRSLMSGDVYSSFLGFIWFGFAQLLMAGFAITQVARWSAEDADGRLDLILSEPTSRTRLIAERAIVLTLGALAIAAVSGLSVGIEARYQSIALDQGRLVEASILLVPFTLVFAAVGAVLAALIPRAAVGLLGAFVFASYLVQQLGAVFRWPTWLQDLSAFKLYGQPLSSGVDQTGLAIMMVIVVAGFVASAVVMEQRDVGA